MEAMSPLEQLKAGFGERVEFRQKRPGIIQVFAPLFHEDGDMVDLFIDLPEFPGNPVVVSDHGLTLMRLSYGFDIETPARRKVLSRILSENGITESQGRLSLETTQENLYPALLQFAQAIAKVSSLSAFNREVVQSLFYEYLGDFIGSELAKYRPSPSYRPIPDREDLEVDWRFDVRPANIFLFGVRGSSKARLAALTCRELQISNIPHRSVIVHEDFESGLNKKDQARITNAADKQFVTLPDFKLGAEQFFRRAVEHQDFVQ